MYDRAAGPHFDKFESDGSEELLDAHLGVGSLVGNVAIPECATEEALTVRNAHQHQASRLQASATLRKPFHGIFKFQMLEDVQQDQGGHRTWLTGPEREEPVAEFNLHTVASGHGYLRWADVRSPYTLEAAGTQRR